MKKYAMGKKLDRYEKILYFYKRGDCVWLSC